MTRHLAKDISKKILSLFTVFLMLLSFVPLGNTANAQDAYSIYITATQDDQSFTYMATPVEGLIDTYWVQMDTNAFSSTLTLNISHPSNYLYSPENGAVLTELVDSGDSLSIPCAITVLDGDSIVTTIYLYASSMPIPQVTQTPTEVPTEEPTEEPTQAPQNAFISIICYGTDGTLLSSETRELAPGVHTISPATDNIEGYLLLPSSGNVDVTVYDDGSASPSEVVFTYEKPYVPKSADVSVYYKDQNDVTIDSFGFTITEGDEAYAVSAKDFGPEYVLVEDASCMVSIDANGNVTPGTIITFIYNYTPPAVTTEVTYTINYVLDGTTIFDSQSYTTQMGADETFPVIPETALAGEYGFDGPESYVLSLDENGVLLPSDTLVFNYHSIVVETPTETPTDVPTEEPSDAPTATPTEAPTDTPTDTPTESPTDIPTDAPTEAPSEMPTDETTAPPSFEKDITIAYVDQSGSSIAPSSHVTFTQAGEMPINAATIDGYTLNDLPVKYVEIREDGTSDVDTLSFSYVLSTPSSVPVMVYHKDGAGGDLITPYEQSCAAGQQTQIDAQPISGYALEVDQPASYSITVSADGVAQTDNVIFQFVKVPEDVPVENGQIINRYGLTNAASVNVRSTPSTSGKLVDTIKKTGTPAFMYITESNNSGENWTKVLYNGKEGYIRTDLLDMMTQFDSDRYEQLQPSPAPIMTPSATSEPTPTQTPTPEVTATPSETPSPTEMPTETAAPMYTGYALTLANAALRAEISQADSSLIQVLPESTLVKCNMQVGTSEVWSNATTLDNVTGFILDASLKRISNEEAAYYIQLYEDAKATATPTLSPTPAPTSQPPQVMGYAVTVGDNVPLRIGPSGNSMLINMLVRGEYMYVLGQEYESDIAWHIVRYGDSQYGYIRADQVHMLSAAETEAYLNSLQTVPPTPSYSPPVFDGNSDSSYGYATDSVNFRETPSTSGRRIKSLNKYAFALVLGTETVNGEAWYKISVGGTQGYVLSTYFKILSMYELEEFLQSPQYVQGNANNTSNSGNSGSSGSSTGSNNSSGGLVSQEDVNVGTWTNPNSGVNASYKPFDPFATLEPIDESATTTVDATTEIIPTFEPVETIEPIDFDTQETQSSNALGVVLGIVGLAIVGGGGAYAYSIYRSNQKKAAARAAQRRSMQQNQRPTSSAGRPYARPAQPSQPNAGSTQGQQARRPIPPQGTVQSSTSSQRPVGTTTQPPSHSNAARETGAMDSQSAPLRTPPPLQGTTHSDAYRRPRQAEGTQRTEPLRTPSPSNENNTQRPNPTDFPDSAPRSSNTANRQPRSQRRPIDSSREDDA